MRVCNRVVAASYISSTLLDQHNGLIYYFTMRGKQTTMFYTLAVVVGRQTVRCHNKQIFFGMKLQRRNTTLVSGPSSRKSLVLLSPGKASITEVGLEDGPRQCSVPSSPRTTSHQLKYMMAMLDDDESDCENFTFSPTLATHSVQQSLDINRKLNLLSDEMNGVTRDSRDGAVLEHSSLTDSPSKSVAFCLHSDDLPQALRLKYEKLQKTIFRAQVRFNIERMRLQDEILGYREQIQVSNQVIRRLESQKYYDSKQTADLIAAARKKHVTNETTSELQNYKEKILTLEHLVQSSSDEHIRQIHHERQTFNNFISKLTAKLASRDQEIERWKSTQIQFTPLSTISASLNVTADHDASRLRRKVVELTREVMHGKALCTRMVEELEIVYKKNHLLPTTNQTPLQIQ